MKTSVVVADPSCAGLTSPLVGSYDQVARRASELGYDAIQLTVNRPLEIPVPEVLRAVETYDLAVSSIATGLGYTVDGLWLGDSAEEGRRAAVQRMKQHVDLAVQLGGTPRVIIGAIRGLAKNSGGWDRFERQFRASVQELLDYAVAREVTVILEANDHLETDAYLSVRETAEFIAGFQCPHFRLQLDTMHMLYERQDVYREVLEHAALIAQVDISDENRMAPDGAHFDFPLLMRALKEINYSDYLVFEFRPAPPEDAARIGLEYIRGLL